MNPTGYLIDGRYYTPEDFKGQTVSRKTRVVKLYSREEILAGFDAKTSLFAKDGEKLDQLMLAAHFTLSHEHRQQLAYGINRRLPGELRITRQLYHTSRDNRELTTEQEEAYIMASNRCPMCNCDQIEGQSVSIEDECAVQKISCLNCGSVWEDEYTLTGITNFEAGEIPQPTSDNGHTTEPGNPGGSSEA